MTFPHRSQLIDAIIGHLDKGRIVHWYPEARDLIAENSPAAEELKRACRGAKCIITKDLFKIGLIIFRTGA